MNLFGNLNLTWVDGLIIGLVCLFVEYPVKKWICKSDEKYKALYTFLPSVLCAVVYLVVSLITKQPWLSGLLKGVTIGFSTMGCYDTIIALIKKDGLSSIEKIGLEIADTVDKKEGKTVEET